jgi:hypothetical protein
MTPDAGIAPQLPAGLPGDWLLDVDLPCPTCRYNLRKLHSPRCPECGGAFRWQTLLQIACPRCAAPLDSEDGANCPQCKLALDWARLLGERDPAEFTQFEYTLRPVRAGFATSLQAMWPRSFWRSIRLEWPPRLERLRRLRLIASSFFVGGIVLLYLVVALTIRLRWMSSNILEQVVAWFAPAVPPLLTAALLPMFTPTLSRFQIRGDQLVRISAYGSIGLAWLGLTYMTIAAIALLVPTLTPFFSPAVAAALPTPFFPDVLAGLECMTIRETPMAYSRVRGLPTSLRSLSAATALLIALLGFLWWWRFVFVSLRDYLRLNRVDAWALTLSTQTIVLICVMIFLSACGGRDWTLYFGRLLVP